MKKVLLIILLAILSQAMTAMASVHAAFEGAQTGPYPSVPADAGAGYLILAGTGLAVSQLWRNRKKRDYNKYKLNF